MEISPKPATTKGSPDRFQGDVWIDVIAGPEAPSRVRMSLVRFAPGARNAWHAHPLGQTLHIVEGVGRVQARGGEVLEVHAGDTIVTAPGEWHWHGAAPDHYMAHLAIWQAPDEGPEHHWGEHVSESGSRGPEAGSSSADAS